MLQHAPRGARRSAKAWISISSAMTAKPRRWKISCAASKMLSKRDLEQFRLWYSQAGTPEIEAEGDYDAEAQNLYAELEAARAADAGPARQEAHAYSACARRSSARSGKPLRSRSKAKTRRARERVLELQQAGTAVLSSPASQKNRCFRIGRGFSAPVDHQDADGSPRRRAFLMARDTRSPSTAGKRASSSPPMCCST